MNEIETASWNGRVNCLNVANFHATALPFKSNSNLSLFPNALEITSWIDPIRMWPKFLKWNKQKISIFILVPSSAIDDTGQAILLKFLETRERYGTVHVGSNLVDNFYLMPLSAGVLLPQPIVNCCNTPLSEDHPDLMVAIVLEKEAARSTVLDTPPIDEMDCDRSYVNYYDTLDKKVSIDDGGRSDTSIDSLKKEIEEYVLYVS